jgi:nicotinamidase-related amidase
MAPHLLPIPLTRNTVHLCIDMQNLFTPEGPWPTPWMPKVLPIVSELAGRFPERTVFTRFITPERPEEMPGMWQRYYARWRNTTRESVDPEMLKLVTPLETLSPPATIINKTRYSAFAESQLHAHLMQRGTDGLVITGSETDVCVLATVMGAVDFGYRVVLVRDAVCSSSDEGHEAMLSLFHRRYTEQVETADAEDILSRWN